MKIDVLVTTIIAYLAGALYLLGDEPQMSWRDEAKLPLLRATLVKPTSTGNEFVVTRHEVRFVKADVDLQSKDTTKKQFKSEEEAENAARKWILNEFGALPNGVSINAAKVLSSASGNEKPKYGWDEGYTVVFRENFNIIPTYGGATIYIVGETIFKASVSLFKYCPQGDSKTVLRKDEAIKILKSALLTRVVVGVDKQKPPKLRLEYDRDPKDNESVGLDYDLLAPTWIIDSNEPAKINGFSGRFWVDD